MKKLLSLLATISLSSGLILTSTACTSPNSDTNTDSDAAQLINLSDVIRTTDLGITMVNTNKSQVLTDIKAKNPTASTLTENDFKIIQSSNNNITIAGIDKYKGEVTLKYTNKIKKLNLRDVLINKDLGVIYVGQNDNPSLEQIKTAIENQNPNLETDYISNIEINAWNKSGRTAIVTGDDKQYIGTVEVEFTITNFEVINSKFGDSINHITLDSNGNIYVASRGHVYKSTDGSNFIKMPKFFGHSIPALVADDNGNIFASSDDGQIFIHTSSSINKDQFNDFSNKIINNGNKERITSMVIDQNDNFYVGTFAGNVYRQHNQYGYGFKIINGTKGNDYSGDNEIKSLVYGGAGNVYALNRQGEIYESISGADFKQSSLTMGKIFTHLAVGRHNYIYAITNSGEVFNKTNGAFFSVGKIDNLNLASSLMIDKNSGIIYVSDRGGIYRSNSTDNKFTLMSGSRNTIAALATDKDGNLYAGNENGILYKSSKLI